MLPNGIRVTGNWGNFGTHFWGAFQLSPEETKQQTTHSSFSFIRFVKFV